MGDEKNNQTRWSKHKRSLASWQPSKRVDLTFLVLYALLVRPETLIHRTYFDLVYPTTLVSQPWPATAVNRTSTTAGR